VGVLIGLGAGLGALALLWGIREVTSFALTTLVGYTPPAPGGEGGSGLAPAHPAMLRPWLLPLVGAAAGLLGGLVIWRFAPTTAGIGTDAAIRSFHRNEDIPLRVAALKVATSALTIGAGLTSGREGPIAQIGAGVGTTVARWLKLTARERNVALAAGLGAGIAAMFKAPLAGAIIGAEIFYTEDFEVDALLPALIASVVGYTVVGYAVGFQPVFSVAQGGAQFTHPLSLALYALLGVACALAARSAVVTFGGVRALFGRVPLYVATTCGGLLTGALALAIPSVIGTGYGYAQVAVLGNTALLPPLFLLAAAAAEILGASLTLGTGNSGGIFGPSVVTGAFLGGAFGWAAALLAPGIAGPLGNYAIVGMMAYFAAAAKAPLSTIVMIAEMTGGYGLLGPSMAAVVVAFVLSGRRSIFPSQVRTRLDSPYHREDYEPIVLRRVRVAEVMTPDPRTLGPSATIAQAAALMQEGRFGCVPIVAADGALLGMVRRRDALRVHPDEREKRTVEEVMRPAPTAAKDQDLFTLLERTSTEAASHFAVVDHGMVVGVVTRRDVGRAIERAKRIASAGA
jgi:CIC family chloride channel protein